MAGYDRRAALPVYHFTFEGSHLDGFEFDAYAPSYDGEHAALLLALAERPGVSPARWLLTLRPVLLDLGHALDEWNLTRGGRPVQPSTRELLRLDRVMLADMVRAWSASVTPDTSATPDADADAPELPESESDVDELVDELFELDIPQAIAN